MTTVPVKNVKILEIPGNVSKVTDHDQENKVVPGEEGNGVSAGGEKNTAASSDIENLM